MDLERHLHVCVDVRRSVSDVCDDVLCNICANMLCTATGEYIYLKSCWRSSSSPGDDWGFSSSPEDRATTTHLRLVGVRATAFFFKLRAACRGSCRCFVRRSSAASSLAVSSPPRSELSSWVWREGDRGRFNLDPALFGILSRGARH